MTSPSYRLLHRLLITNGAVIHLLFYISLISNSVSVRCELNNLIITITP